MSLPGSFDVVQRFACQNQRRLSLLREAPGGDNALEYLEVLDSAAPADSPPQQTLFVRLLRDAAGLTGANVRIAGGVRVTPVTVRWAALATDVPALAAAGLLNAAEAAEFAAQPEPARLLIVRTDAAGDFSAYTLQLVESPTADAPPDGFDPILSAISFSFKVECPSEFDCAPDDACPPERYPAPVINYLAKDYLSFRQLIFDRLAVTNPQWQERHAPDLQVALVELLAYVGDYLSYYQDAVATESYLGTARRRTSVRRHARALGYAMHDGCNARAWVALTVDGAAEGLTLAPAASLFDPPVRFLTRMPGEAVVLSDHLLDELLARHQPTVFELRTAVTLRRAHNLIHFHTWGDTECCLPAGATRATLADSADPTAQLQLAPGDHLIFEEIAGPITGLTADARRNRRHAVRLTEVQPAHDPLFNQPVLEIGWAGEDALPFPLCISRESETGALQTLSVVRGNVALADHGRTLPAEELPARTGHRTYRPMLNRLDVTRSGSIDPLQPAAAALAQDPRRALPQVELQGDAQRWTPQRDLLDSDRFSPHFVAEMESDDRVYLRFGEDPFGLAPGSDAFVRDESDPADFDGAAYRIGSGAAGNIGADALGHIMGSVAGSLAGIVSLRNPLPARGGVEPEAPEEVRQYAPQAFRRQERAVTAADYGEVAERHPEVQRAVATRRWTGSWHTMFIAVDRKGGRPIDPLFEADLRRHLARYRLAGHDVEIDPPRFVALDIRMSVCVKEGYFRSEVKRQLLLRFGNGILPDGEPAFFHPDRFTFGQAVYLSEVVAAAMAVPGVLWVDLLPRPERDHRFQRWGELANNEIALGRIELARLEIARLDNDPSLPENGRIEFYMEGGA
jgi:hypothetical protein